MEWWTCGQKWPRYIYLSPKKVSTVYVIQAMSGALGHSCESNLMTSASFTCKRCCKVYSLYYNPDLKWQFLPKLSSHWSRLQICWTCWWIESAGGRLFVARYWRTYLKSSVKAADLMINNSVLRHWHSNSEHMQLVCRCLCQITWNWRIACTAESSEVSHLSDLQQYLKYSKVQDWMAKTQIAAQMTQTGWGRKVTPLSFTSAKKHVAQDCLKNLSLTTLPTLDAMMTVVTTHPSQTLVLTFLPDVARTPLHCTLQKTSFLFCTDVIFAKRARCKDAKMQRWRAT